MVVRFGRRLYLQKKGVNARRLPKFLAGFCHEKGSSTSDRCVRQPTKKKYNARKGLAGDASALTSPVLTYVRRVGTCLTIHHGGESTQVGESAGVIR